METLPNIVSFGAALLDFLQTGKNSFAFHTGGTPVNISVAAAKLGTPTALIASVGDDYFGAFLLNELKIHNIDTSSVATLSEANTSLAFILEAIEKEQNPKFLFYRDADLMISREQFEDLNVGSPLVFCFSSSSIQQPNVYNSLIAAIRKFKDKNAIIFFDLNIRKSLWHVNQSIRENVNEFLHKSDIIKANLEEAYLITGVYDPSASSRLLLQESNKLVVITLQEKGCFYRTDRDAGYVPSFTVDSELGDPVGAGDAFVGAMCSGIVDMCLRGENYLNSKILHNILLRANAAGALTAAEKGANAQGLTLDNIEKLVNSV